MYIHNHLQRELLRSQNANSKTCIESTPGRNLEEHAKTWYLPMVH